jgi:biopolymer transport protein ExbD
MGLTSPQQDGDAMTEINITPFTDVLLVLLIIFMILAALATPPGFQKELARNVPHKNGPDIIRHEIQVQVSANNRIFVEGRLTPITQLDGALSKAVTYHKAHAKNGYTTHISLIADAATPYNTVIKILDAARAAGDDDVGFVTQK